MKDAFVGNQLLYAREELKKYYSQVRALEQLDSIVDLDLVNFATGKRGSHLCKFTLEYHAVSNGFNNLETLKNKGVIKGGGCSFGGIRGGVALEFHIRNEEMEGLVYLSIFDSISKLE